MVARAPVSEVGSISSKMRGGRIVPALYGSNMEDGAISETIFHDVPIQGAIRTVPESRLDNAAIVALHPLRDLALVELLGYGLRRLQLQLQPGDLTSTEPTAYPRTVPWAEALHQAFPEIDGLVWMSKQFNSAKALVLFGDRIQQADLSVANAPLPLRVGPGRTLVSHAANQAGIVIISGSSGIPVRVGALWDHPTSSCRLSCRA